ncbi:hypothetical protein IKF84_01585 [Candidatus Saccharibacteria bacterium]|nr:hypothetical protein [Candidatus Saccharibacteria bacterium]
MYQGMDTRNAAPAGVSAMENIAPELVVVADIATPVFIVALIAILVAIRYGITTEQPVLEA